MKQNQKGFTLIELLAVIVILAIIALIATPIILNVVEDSRLSAAKDSAYGAIEAVKLAYSQNQLDTDAESDVTVDFSKAESEWKIGERKVTISGTKPSGGTINIGPTGDIKVTDLKIGNYYCSGTNDVKCGPKED